MSGYIYLMFKVYLISANYPDSQYYKIGWTKRDPIKRLKELKTGNSQELELVDFFESKWGPRIESNLHKFFNQNRCEGEWFKLNQEDVSNFRELCQKNHNMFELMEKENSWFRQSKEFSKYI
jgi:hypothetical protein